jgi:antibiotic biosynthesis monooxygenase (ABM) superfamily enzyme
MPLHVAITRQVRPGCETRFEQELRAFFQRSFDADGVRGALLLVPPPGSGSREYGILRTFAGEAERDAFYRSPLFQTWDEQVKPLTEGGCHYRELHGLEAWFRSAGDPPPRWKMALATFLGVFPVATALNLTLGQTIRTWPFLLGSALFNACVVALLTWVVMPLVTRLLHSWLHPQTQTK